MQRRVELDTLQEDREMALIMTEVVKHKMARKYNSKAIGRKFNEGDLVLRTAEK